MPRASCLVPRASFLIPHSPFLIPSPRATCPFEIRTNVLMLPPIHSEVPHATDPCRSFQTEQRHPALRRHRNHRPGEPSPSAPAVH
ncbi:MAG: hypothetical protein C0506_14375 [Anaerolinea sp.]|nr:hypothetical protein [Anaerolinea sp.]